MLFNFKNSTPLLQIHYYAFYDLYLVYLQKNSNVGNWKSDGEREILHTYMADLKTYCKKI